MGLIRKFFWGMIASAVLMVVSSQVNAPAMLIGKINELRQIQTEVQSQAARLKRMVEETPVEALVKPPKKIIVNGKEMVIIDGQLYEKKDDNIYTINGERIYYVDNSDGKKEPPRQEIEVEKEKVAANEEGGAKRGPVNVPSLPMPGMSANPAEIMLQLQKMQKEMKERDKFLNELMAEEPGSHSISGKPQSP